MVRLSDMLFNEVRRQFGLLVSGVGLPPEMTSSTDNNQHFNIMIPFEHFALLLRCCMAILQLLEFDPSVVLEKCQILLTILERLCSLDLILHAACHKVQSGESIFCFKKSVSHECKYTLDDAAVSCIREELDASMHFAKQGCSSVALLCSILEVFTDELLVHHHLREHFVQANRVSFTKERLFICEGGYGDIVLEVISAHFLLSVSGESGINGFPETLFWSYDKDFKIPQLSVTAAMAMLGTSAVYTAPEVLQAHLISLASESIGIEKPPENMKLNPLLLNSYILAFELSVNLYTRCNLTFRMGSWVMEPCIMDRVSGSTFKAYVQPDTYVKIHSQLSKLIDPCHPCFRCMFSRPKSDMLSASIEYIKENDSIIDKSCRDEACLILNYVIEMILCGDMGVKVPHHQEEINRQELYFLAAALKLMSCSLLQVVWCMRSYGTAGGLKTLKDFFDCQEYDLITTIVSCFGQCIVNQPIQRTLLGVMGTYPARHKDSKLVLVHFAGLLSFSFDAGVDFLWKDNIFVMMALMNLLFFEEGNLDALLPLIDRKEKSFFSQSSTEVSQDLVCRSSSRIVASNFEKIQTLYICERRCLTYSTEGLATHALSLVEKPDGQVKSSQNTLDNPKDTEDDCEEEEDIDTVSGRNFLEDLGMSSDSIDDLADFVVCKRGKDYSSWMKMRLKYRKWKCGKMRVERERRARTMALEYIKDTGSKRHRRM
eukprot:TRINITY_DN5391_c0_g1_i4.p1 TRINITY_DN5391_c0_g1~~TRINITY_DN5391_c0_g1_i4.p1  ORF type:complete len:797 (-),score=127.96 TRINITY_DN5391_c0_g1_i4:140-2281(-)